MLQVYLCSVESNTLSASYFSSPHVGQFHMFSSNFLSSSILYLYLLHVYIIMLIPPCSLEITQIARIQICEVFIEKHKHRTSHIRLIYVSPYINLLIFIILPLFLETWSCFLFEFHYSHLITIPLFVI